MRVEIVNNAPNVKVTTNEIDDTIIITLSQTGCKTLGECEMGSVVKIGKREYIVLQQLGVETALIAKDFTKKMAFGKTGDYLDSDIRKYLNGEFYKELVAAVGKDNIVKHLINLTADDGTGVADCDDYVSILTTSGYRAYRKFLPAYGSWWYTATRVSADVDGYARNVCYVRSSGVLGWSDCGNGSGGVRPFVVLKSSLLI